jgi:flagellar motor switch protein FliN/FliY
MSDETKTNGSMELTDLEDEVSEAELPATSDEDAGESDGIDLQKYATDLEAVFDVPVNVSAVLGKTHIEVSQLLKLGRGAVVELDRKVGEAIDIYVNDRLVARGEVVIVEDRLGITMTEIIKSGQV